MGLFKSGDVVRVHHYPYISKAEKERLGKEGAENGHPLFYEGKPRYGIVIGAGAGAIIAIPVVQVMTHDGKTEENGYKLRDDEIRVPQHTHFMNKHGDRKGLYGVIKMERIEVFGADEMTVPLTNVPLRTKIDMLERYNYILKNPYFKNKLDEHSPGHEQAMRQFKESVIAEKLNFLVTESGENKYDVMRKSPLFVDEIQHVGNHNRLDIYALKLQGRRDSFSYSIATTKSVKEIKQDWNDIKPAVYWLKQDQKFWALSKNIDQRIVPDPLPHPDNYVSLGKLNSKQLAKDRKLENEYGK